MGSFGDPSAVSRFGFGCARGCENGPNSKICQYVTFQIGFVVLSERPQNQPENQQRIIKSRIVQRGLTCTTGWQFWVESLLNRRLVVAFKVRRMHFLFHQTVGCACTKALLLVLSSTIATDKLVVNGIYQVPPHTPVFVYPPRACHHFSHCCDTVDMSNETIKHENN